MTMRRSPHTSRHGGTIQGGYTMYTINEDTARRALDEISALDL